MSTMRSDLGCRCRIKITKVPGTSADRVGKYIPTHTHNTLSHLHTSYRQQTHGSQTAAPSMGYQQWVPTLMLSSLSYEDCTAPLPGRENR